MNEKKTKGFLSKEDMLGAKLEVTEVEVPRLGGKLRVRELTGHQRDKFQSFIEQNTTFDSDGNPHMTTKGLRIRLIQMSVIDGDGNLMFEESDLPKLQQVPAKAIETLAVFLQEFNGIGGPVKN